MFHFLQISVYAAYLYDSVLLYARALDEVLKALGTSGATNGREIFNHIKGRSYMSEWGLVSVTYLGGRPLGHAPFGLNAHISA